MDFIDVILAILNVVTVVLTLFLIGIILIQRGKGRDRSETWTEVSWE